jgi:hypothetical protein
VPIDQKWYVEHELDQREFPLIIYAMIGYCVIVSNDT